MIIQRLIESMPNITNDDIQKWNKADNRTRTHMTNSIIQEINKPGLENIKDAITNQFEYAGIDPKKNLFINVLDGLDFQPSSKHQAYFNELVKLQINNGVNPGLKYIANPSLYELDMKDFIYTVKLLDTVDTPYKLRKYFKDTTNIKPEKLFVNGDVDGQIKPVGKEGDGTDTLYGTVESWSEVTTTENSTENGYSLTQAFQQLNVSTQSQKDTLISWIKTYFTKARPSVLKHKNIDYYINAINSLFNTVTTQKDLTDIQRKMKNAKVVYILQDEYPQPNEDGEVIFAYHNKRSNDVKTFNSKDNIINNYLIGNNGKWVTLEQATSHTNTTVNKEAKKDLFSKQIISDLSDKVSITRGVIEILDKYDIEVDNN